MIKIQKYLKGKSLAINRSLDRYLPGRNIFPSQIHQAMRYSVLAGGKRLRGILVLSSGRLFKVPERILMPVAVAFELVHTYSLIHDDLPAMDNDDFRRGKPTSHRVFGEALAILTGDALLPLAFQLLADKIRNPKVSRQLVKEISQAAGSRGMVGGQVLDLTQSKTDRKKKLLMIHLLKTAALITAAVRAGALVAKANPTQLACLTRYGRNLGLAFQIMDDILDIKGDRTHLGKTPGKDRVQAKLTYPALYGLEHAETKARRLINRAKQALHPFHNRAEILSALADYVINRTY